MGREKIRKMEKAPQEKNLTKVEKKSAKRQQKLLALNKGDQKSYAKKVKRLSKGGLKHEKAEPGVVYVGHLPTQTSEPILRKYFEQFGNITRLRLSRSKKSGRSKGYGFIEFENAKDARIAVKTMDKYLFHERILTCKILEKEKIHENLWKNAGGNFDVGLVYRHARTVANKNQTEDNFNRSQKKLKKKDEALLAALKEAGVEGYEIPKSVGKPTLEKNEKRGLKKKKKKKKKKK